MKRNAFLVIIISLVALVAGTAMAYNSVPMTVRASSMIGAKAIDPDGQTLGTVYDLVIAEDNQSSIVLVATADDSAYVALPFTAASPQVNSDRKVVLSVAKKDFEQAPSFASNNGPKLTRPERANGRQPSGTNYVNGIWTWNPYTF